MDVRLRKLTAVFFVLTTALSLVSGNLVFNVENKFRIGGHQKTLSALKDHDARRRGRFLASIDLPIGGNGLPSETGYVRFSLLRFGACDRFIGSNLSLHRLF